MPLLHSTGANGAGLDIIVRNGYQRGEAGCEEVGEKNDRARNLLPPRTPPSTSGVRNVGLSGFRAQPSKIYTGTHEATILGRALRFTAIMFYRLSREMPDPDLPLLFGPSTHALATAGR